LAGAVTEDLAPPVLDVAIPRTKWPAGGGDGSTCNAAHDCADRTFNHGPSDDAGRRSGGLLRGLTSRCCQADDSCENERSHEVVSCDGRRRKDVTLTAAARFIGPGSRFGRVALVAVAGPLTNVLLAFASALLFQLVWLLPAAAAPWLAQTLFQSILLNLVLAPR